MISVWMPEPGQSYSLHVFIPSFKQGFPGVAVRRSEDNFLWMYLFDSVELRGPSVLGVLPLPGPGGKGPSISLKTYDTIRLFHRTEDSLTGIDMSPGRTEADVMADLIKLFGGKL